MELIQQTPADPRSANAWRHGLRARRVLVRAEDVKDFETLRDALVDEWRPRNVTAWLLVDHLARLQWRLLRAGEAETDRLGRLQSEPGFGVNVGGNANSTEAGGATSAEAALAWDVSRAGSSLQRIQLYQMRLERAVHRAIAMLIVLRKFRGKRGGLRRTGADKKSPQTQAGPGVDKKCAQENGTNKMGTDLKG